MRESLIEFGAGGDSRHQGRKLKDQCFLTAPAAAPIWPWVEVVLVVPPPLKGKLLERAVRTARR